MTALLTGVALDALAPETVVVLTEGRDAGTAWVRRWDTAWASVRVAALGVGPGQGVPAAVLARWAPVVVHTPGDLPSVLPPAIYNERWPDV